MGAVCVLLSLFPFELSAQSQGPRAQTGEGTELSVRVDKIHLHSPAQQLPQSSTGHFILPFLPARGKITLLVYLTKEEWYYSDYWKIGFVNNFEGITVLLPSSINGQNFGY